MKKSIIRDRIKIEVILFSITINEDMKRNIRLSWTLPPSIAPSIIIGVINGTVAEIALFNNKSRIANK